MEKQVQIFVFEHPKYGIVHSYRDENDTVYFNVADTARVLGITQIKNGVEYIRIDRVNAYLKAFGFPHIVGKEDFIPENMVYRLAMKANNKIAKDFQSWLADEVVPQIFRTGSYSLPKVEKKAAAEKIIVEKPVIVEKQVVVEKPVVVPNQPLPKYHEFVKEIFKSARIIHQDSGLDYNLCVLTVAEMMEEKYGIDLTHIKNLFPVEDPEIEYYTPTQIGKLIGQKNGTIKYSAKKVNKLLIKYGLQEKDIKGNYSLTKKGKNYGVAIPYFNNGRTGYQVKWSDKVLELF